jgi:hypothetical protein
MHVTAIMAIITAGAKNDNFAMLPCFLFNILFGLKYFLG